MSRASVEQPFSYQSLFEVVKQRDFWTILQNTLDLRRLIYAICTDLHGGVERLVSLNWWLQCNRFPYNEDITDRWSQEKIPGQQGQRRDINILNVSLNEEDRKKWEGWHTIVEKGAGLPNLDGTLLFHGTSHNSALSILQVGINLSRGGKQLDFSDEEGFYVTNDFSEIIQYAQYSSSRNAEHLKLGAAVIIYDVNKEQLNQNCQGLNLGNDLNMWRKVVKEYRQKKNIDRCFREQLEVYSFIEGPVSNGCTEGEFQPDLPHKRQLCIRHSDCARTFFDPRLNSVIFFEKPEQLVNP